MAKKIKFESFKYRFLIAAQDATYQPENKSWPTWIDFVRTLEFDYENGQVHIAWRFPKPGKISLLLDEPIFYLRGDSEKNAVRQSDANLLNTEDPIKCKNDVYFKECVIRVTESAGYKKNDNTRATHEERIKKERKFHDDWANSENVEKIDVRVLNEACTAPEIRFITQRLGDLKGKNLLDVGCGLGEASVYFAILGANVTSLDLSQGMLDATTRLACLNGVSIKQHVASAEDMQLPPEAKFDIIYAGNLLHHVDIEETISRIKSHLAVGGVFVSWDPLSYNPAINIYRSMAVDVRTLDEHPFKWRDIKIFHKHFGIVETRYFWLTTLIIFVIMALAQRRNPNKERFWKIVVQEGRKWRWLYSPLEKLDYLLLWLAPPLRLLCWNVVVIAKNSIPSENRLPS